MPTKVIWNLGVQFCDIEPEKLSDEALKKGRKLQPILKKRKTEDAKEKKAEKSDPKKQKGKGSKKGKKGGQEPDEESL
jgi:hypothetical protein